MPQEPETPDDEFDQLIEHNFGTKPVSPRPYQDFDAPKPPSNPPDIPASSLIAAWDRADEIDDEPYRPVVGPITKNWSFSTLLAVIALAAGLVLALLIMMGLPLGGTMRLVAGGLTLFGLAALLFKALRRREPPRDDDGAVL